jgi:hypothetical protein
MESGIKKIEHTCSLQFKIITEKAAAEISYLGSNGKSLTNLLSGECRGYFLHYP